MSLFVSKRLVRAIVDTLQRAPSPSLGCAGAPRLARALREAGVDVVEEERGELGAVLVRDLVSHADWERELDVQRERLVAGGVLISIDKAKGHEASGRLLCGGFTDVWQSQVARKVLSSAVRD